MKTPAAFNNRRIRPRIRPQRAPGTTSPVWRVLATVAMLCALAGTIVAAPSSPVVASSQDCENGQVWDDSQQMCVDPTPDGGVSDQEQPVETVADGGGDSSDSSDLPTATETPLPTPTSTATAPVAGTLVVSTLGCPSGYAFTKPGANPSNDCTTTLDGVQVTLRAQNQPPVQQASSAGSTTFINVAAGSFSLDETGPVGATDVAWACQGTMGQLLSGTGASIAGQIDAGEQLTCSFFIVTPSTVTTTTTATATATPTTTITVETGQDRPNFAGTSGSPAPSLTGPGAGSIRIVMSMCPPGFDPNAAGANPGNSCGGDYRFVAYPIPFTAIGKSSDMSTTGVQDTFLDWITFDGLEPDTYRVQAPIPAGLSAVIDKYGTCGEAVSTSGGLVAFDMKIDAGGFVSCDLAAVPDPAAPTPTRAPSTDSSNLSVGTGVCPAGFDVAAAAGSFSACASGTAGIQYNVSGPAGSANLQSAAAADSLSIRAFPGVYHIVFTIPDGIASIAGGRCTPYDLHEQQWVDDVALTLTTSGREVSGDVDVPGAMIFGCTVYAVPTGPSPTPTASPTLTPTITPTSTATQPPTATQASGQVSTGSQGAPAGSGNGSTSQPQGGSQGGPGSSGSGPANTGASATGTPGAGATGGLAFVINSFLCPVGVPYSSSTVMPEGCFDPYTGSVFTVKGLKTGVSLQAATGDILPGAALFTDLPMDEYVITQQFASGIVGSLGTCTLLGGDAQGVPVTPYAYQGNLQQVFNVATRVFVCDWYSIPDATFAGIPSPNSPQGVSLTIHAFSCPAGYDPSSADARPTLDCLAPASGVPFSLAGQASGAAVEQTTGADAAANPQEGTSRSGTTTFTGLTADTYTLTQGNPDGPANAFISSCSLATAQDADVPIYPTVSQGSIQYQFNDNEALTCLWYIVPRDGQAGQATDGGPGQGGATDDSAPDGATNASAQGGATDNSAQGGATDDTAPADAAPPDDAAAGAPSTLYLFTYQCEAGYDPTANGANPSSDCTTPLEGLPVSIVGTSAGVPSQMTTGENVPGGLVVSGLAPDTYHITATLAAGQTIFAAPCDVNGATDGSVQPAIPLAISASGEMDLVVPADRTIACTWYIVPSGSAALPAGPGFHASSVIGSRAPAGLTRRSRWNVAAKPRS